ncbi:serine/threonine protein kinase [Nocardioides sp. zg-ZUI104]|uniref:serine/threonine-protein kinase n=1 Tax=Nocardioides faecalis TaxID=2803858 RepID=UPI001BCED3DD|nr:serine/threonine-protein kinase [Nocardioides faecalis]MBS4752925.1 serine/threonine protein kinase [Nocardioides faecalis]
MSRPWQYDEPAPGAELGPYRVVRRLGAGGMGIVYEALDTVLERTVALKLIAPEHAADPDFRQRFVREARAQAALDSPHVVQVFAHGEVAGRLYLATQLVPDGDLAALLRHGPVPFEEAMQVGAQVADALAEAHRAGLVHRDVKPGNVLLRRRGSHTVAYLSDFGLAGPALPHASGPRHGGPAGTPGYLAPEVLAGEAAGAAADVYALGRLLATALTGGPPGSAPPAVDRLAGRRRLREVLEAAVAPDPAARPSAAALAAALRSTTSRGRGRRSARRVVLGGAGVAAAGALLLAPVLAPARPERPEHRSEPSAAPVAEDARMARLAKTLAARAGLSETEASCTAETLLRRARPSGSSAPASGSGPEALSQALAAAADCLWPRPTP